jgi:hypothetical protein
MVFLEPSNGHITAADLFLRALAKAWLVVPSRPPAVLPGPRRHSNVDRCDRLHTLSVTMKRREALALDLAEYQTGKPCKYSHYSPRNIKSAKCLECAAAYGRAYYDGHRDEIIAQHRLCMPTTESIKMRKWQANNSEHVNAYMRNYYLQRRAKISAADPE